MQLVHEICSCICSHICICKLFNSTLNELTDEPGNHFFELVHNYSGPQFDCEYHLAITNNNIEQMSLQVTKNIQFTRLIKADGHLREFNFRKLGGLQEGFFRVDVTDERGDRLVFNMQKDEHGWEIAEAITDRPDWILAVTQSLHEKMEEVMPAGLTLHKKEER